MLPVYQDNFIHELYDPLDKIVANNVNTISNSYHKIINEAFYHIF